MKHTSNFSLIVLSLFLFSVSLSAQKDSYKLLSTKDNKDHSVSLVLSSVNTDIFTSSTLFEPENLFQRESRLSNRNRIDHIADLWSNGGGYAIGIKFGKRINNNLLDSNISLDVISGIEYQEANLNQETYNPHGNSFGAIESCFAINYTRKIKMKSILIPLELRSNINLKRFTISPTLGLGINVPISINHKLYYPDYGNHNGQLTTLEFYKDEKLEANQAFTINSISKIECSYRLPNEHKIKCAGYYNLNITNEFSNELREGLSFTSSGIQLGYEVPLSHFTRS